MIVFLVRRLIYAFILLWIVSLIAFWLSKKMPGDEVIDYLSIDARDYGLNENPIEYREVYTRVAHLRGLDQPGFYFSVSPAYIPDSIHRILPFDDRKAVKHWAYSTRNGQEALHLYQQLRSGLIANCNKGNVGNTLPEVCSFYYQSLTTIDPKQIHQNALLLINSPDKDTMMSDELKNNLHAVVEASNRLIESPDSKANIWIPKITWHGTHNQYHRWMTGLFDQRPLISLVDGRNAWNKIYDAVKWTLLLNGFALLLSLLLGVFIGIWSGIHHGQRSEKIFNWILFALFALPSFWLGTLFIYFFASGEWLSIFPAGGLGPYKLTDHFFEKAGILASHLFLPVLCLTLGSLAYISRQMKQSILHEYTHPYVFMLRSQGISEKTILKKHVISNSLFPVITIIGGAIPVLLSGSLIIEVIFSIPGMGRLMYNSLLARDWPVAFPILMLGAIITIISYILTDIVYKWLDPRIKVNEG